MRWCSWIWLCSFGAACSAEPDASHVPWPTDRTDDLAFLVIETPTGEVTTLGPFRLETGRVVDGSAVVRQQVEAGDELHYVALDAAALEARWPTADLGARSKIRFEAGSEHCLGGRRMDEEMRVPLGPEIAAVSTLRDGAFADVGDAGPPLSLVLPLDDGLCIDAPLPRFTPFGPAISLLPVGGTVGGRRIDVENSSSKEVRDVRRLDDKRLIAATSDHVLIFDRSLGFVDQPEYWWNPESLPRRDDVTPSGWQMRASTIDPVRSTADSARVVVSVYWGNPDAPMGMLLELIWTSNGFAAPVEIARTVESIEALEFDGRGRLIALGDSGLLLTQVSPNEPVVRDTRLNADLRAWMPGFDPEEPDIILAAGALLFFTDLSRGTELRQEPPPRTVRTPRAFLSRPAIGGGTDVYLASDSAEVELRRANRGRELRQIYLPSSAYACAAPEDECGHRVSSTRVIDFVSTPSGTILVLPAACSVLMEYDPKRDCARSIPIENVEIKPRPPMYLVSGVAQDGIISVTGSNGLILESRWP